MPKIRLRKFLPFLINSIGAVDELCALNVEIRGKGKDRVRSKAAACLSLINIEAEARRLQADMRKGF